MTSLPPPRVVARVVLAASLFALAGCAPPRTACPWRAETIPTDAEFRGVWFADSLNGWITGGGYLIEGGIVGRTRDGGRTWRFASGIVPGAGQTFALGGVQFRDTLRGAVVAGGGLVLLTDDGGETWRTTPHRRGTGDALGHLRRLALAADHVAGGPGRTPGAVGRDLR